MQRIAYWPNGEYTDPDTAELAVEVADYPADFKIVELADDADVDAEITALTTHHFYGPV